MHNFMLLDRTEVLIENDPIVGWVAVDLSTQDVDSQNAGYGISPEDAVEDLVCILDEYADHLDRQAEMYLGPKVGEV